MTKQEKLEKLAEAANALRTAKFALAEIVDDGSKENGWYIAPDCAHFAHEIEYLLSGDASDDGGGIDSLIKIVEKEIAND